MLYLLDFHNLYHIGSEAVDWLVKTQQISRDVALKTMQQIFSMRIIYNIGEENQFIDGSYFYTFMVRNGVWRREGTEINEFRRMTIWS